MSNVTRRRRYGCARHPAVSPLAQGWTDCTLRALDRPFVMSGAEVPR